MNNTVRWRIHFMLLNKMVLEGTDILLVIFAIYLFSCYFDIFFTRRKKRILAGIGYMVFVIWQFVLSSVSILPVYINISITIIVTFISVMFIYEGGKLNNPVPVSLLSGDRKPQIRFLGNHHSGSGNLYHKSFRM